MSEYTGKNIAPPQPKDPGVISRLSLVYQRLASMVAFSETILDRITGKGVCETTADAPEGLPVMPALNVIDERLDMLRNNLEQINAKL